METDVRALSYRLMLHRHALEEVVYRGRRKVQLRLARSNAFEIEDVVDQAHQAIRIAYGNLHHLAHLLRAGVESASRDQTERSAQRSKWRTKLVRYSRDELVLHAIECVALADIR